jgi:hypothetical protein
MIQRQIAQRLADLGDQGALAFASIGIILFLFIADVLIERRPFASQVFWALFDVLVNGVLALFLISPIFDIQAETRKTIALFCLFFFTAVLLDLDHFIAAWSFSISDALALKLRPPSHSLTFAAIVGLISALISKNLAISWGMFAALASHILRDASGGITPILWPLPLKAIPWWAYYGGEIGLFLISFLLMKKGFTT